MGEISLRMPYQRSPGDRKKSAGSYRVSKGGGHFHYAPQLSEWMRSMNFRTSKNMARPLGVRGHQKPSILVASHKMGGEMFVETPDESTTMLALDIDPRTRSITSQPFTVRLDLEKVFSTRSDAIKAEPRGHIQKVDALPVQEQIYTPDFLAELTSPIPLVVESKSALEVGKITDALARRGRVLNSLGYGYLVVSSSEVDHHGLHSNLVHMRDATKYRKHNDTRLLLDGLIKLVSGRRTPFLLGEVKGLVPDVCIYLGLISGVIGCDLRSGHLGVGTKLWQAHGDLAHLQLLNLET